MKTVVFVASDERLHAYSAFEWAMEELCGLKVARANNLSEVWKVVPDGDELVLIVVYAYGDLYAKQLDDEVSLSDVPVIYWWIHHCDSLPKRDVVPFAWGGLPSEMVEMAKELLGM